MCKGSFSNMICLPAVIHLWWFTYIYWDLKEICRSSISYYSLSFGKIVFPVQTHFIIMCIIDYFVTMGESWQVNHNWQIMLPIMILPLSQNSDGNLCMKLIVMKEILLPKKKHSHKEMEDLEIHDIVWVTHYEWITASLSHLNNLGLYMTVKSAAHGKELFCDRPTPGGYSHK